MAYILENIGEFQRLERQAEQKNYSLRDELKFLKIKESSTVLDAGCGSGLLSRYIAKTYDKVNVVACDQSDLRLKQAEKATKSENINFFQSSLDAIQLENESVDVVVCRFVYEYLKNPIKVTQEFRRVLKPGGIVYLVDLDGVFLNYWTQNVTLNSYIEKLRNDLDIDLYVGRKLQTFLHSADFKKVSSEVTLHSFETEAELREEYKNNKDRIQFASESLVRALGGEANYEEFKQLYLQEMLSATSTMFFNKFVAWGVK